MKILYIWDADYPWDIRVEKICKSLMKNGNDLHIAARNLKYLPEYENSDGLHIHRLKPFRNKRINNAISFPAFFSPMWKSFIDRIIRKNKIKLIIVRDLPLAIAGIWAGKRHKLPVIFDMAEDYVALIKDIWKARKFKGFNLIVRNPYLAKLVEKYSINNFDHILVVIDEAIDLMKKYGVPNDKVTIVSNTPPLSMFNNSIFQMNNFIEQMRKRYTAIYTGGIQMGRGIQVVLDALPVIIKQIPDFLFVIVGDGYAKKHLMELTKEKRLEDYVLWVGWVEHDRIYDYIKASKIGLIPHFVSDHDNTTVPNKLFDFMGCGIPVIASDSIPMKRILEEEKCGLTFRSGDDSDLSRIIVELNNSDNTYGSNGISAVKQKYNWDEDEKRLINVIKSTSHKRNEY
jgi:glycosyltransferase involved in cell wall biosynthesis